MPKLFLDANIWIAASASATGGSAFILQACREGHFQAIATELILYEAEKNITAKLNQNALSRFHKLLETIPVKIHPPAVTLDQYQNLIDPKDAHVLASAIESQSDFLITLDRQHFFSSKIQAANLPIRILTPKDFILSR